MDRERPPSQIPNPWHHEEETIEQGAPQGLWVSDEKGFVFLGFWGALVMRVPTGQGKVREI